ncbi:MAG TPA: PQQ-binding-like beta-propeller repeat protein [Vicinamibacterales bacterium]|nr:PQQ-binding-like beta-propeller repeat protein [Vicinamibacterales bacterium]
MPPVPVAPAAAKPAVPAVTYESAWQKTIESDSALQIAVAGRRVIVSGAKSALMAIAPADGTEAWAKELPSSVRVASGDGLVFVASGERLHALDETNGNEKWTARIAAGATIGPTWAKGFVVCSSGPELVGIRSADGSEVWRRHVGVDTALPIVIEGGRVFAGLANKTIVVLDLVTGAVERQMLLSAKPNELVAAGDRFYFGADNGVVYAYRANSEDSSWEWPIGVNAVGAPAIDERCVYVAFMDNSVRAYRRGSGSHCWSPRSVTGRPAAGPMLAGTHLVVPLTTGELVILEAKDGRPVRRPDPPTTPAVQLSGATLQAIAASPGVSSVYLVSIGGDQRRVLTAWRRK